MIVDLSLSTTDEPDHGRSGASPRLSPLPPTARADETPRRVSKPAPHPLVIAVGADPDWVGPVCESLRTAPLVIETADCGSKGLALAAQRRPDLIIVDMFLPDVTGLGFCRTLREHPELGGTPLMVVSRHASEVDRVLAFELGADDYLPAPFFDRELASRARAVLRRSAGRARTAKPTPRPVEQGELVFDPGAGRVSVGGQVIDLTRTEFEILGMLIREEGRVLSRRQILGRLDEGANQASERTVDAHVKALRRKLRNSRGCIETVRGSGYRFAGAGDPAGPPSAG